MVSQTRMTAAEFFELPESNQPTELIDGELKMSPPPVPHHQRLIRRLLILLDGLIPDGEVFCSPIGVYFDDTNVLEPDIVWVAEKSQCVITDKRLEGAPDLIVEIFSPGTAKRDKKDKYALYQRHGVHEYWMVDPVGQYIEVCVLKEAVFDQHGVYGPEDTFDSLVLGSKAVELKSIFAE